MSEYLKEYSCPVSASKLSLGGLSSPRLFVEEWTTDQYVTFDMNLNEKYIEVFFAHFDGYYRFRVIYDETLKDSVLLQRYDNVTSLTISGKFPAYFWKSKISMQRLTNTYHLDDWERVTEIPLDEFSRAIIKNKAATSKGPISPGGQYPNHLIKLNMWTVYRLEFEIPLKIPSRYAGSSYYLSSDNLSHELLERKLNQAIEIPQHQRHSRSFVQQRGLDRIFVQSPTKTVDIESHVLQLNFEVRYMMEHVFNLKILREYNVDVGFFEKMLQLPAEVSCMFLLLISAPQERVYNPDSAITHIYRLTREQIRCQQPIPKDCTTIRRVLVTPTSIYPLQPTIEPMNNLQYHFKDYADRFLHVQFTDEDLSPIAPIDVDDNAAEPQNTKLYDRIYAVLRRGLKIAGRTYEFLGCSTKNLQSHSCWFFSPTEEMNRDMILNWMGDFREIKTISRFVSCSGQV
jgi:RNA-dependent RNA polymerase